MIVLRTRPHQEAVLIVIFPVKYHRQGRVIPHIDPGSAAACVGIETVSAVFALELIHIPYGGFDGIPLVRCKNNIFISGIRIGLNQSHRHSVVIDHGQGSAVHAPVIQKTFSFVCAAAHFLQSVYLGMIACHPAAQADLSGLDIIPDQFLCCFFSPIHFIIAEEPGSLHRIAVPILFLSGSRLVTQLLCHVQKCFAALSLDIRGIVQPDIRMG